MYLILFSIGCFPDFPSRNFPPTIDSFSPESGSTVNHQDNVLFSVAITDKDSLSGDINIRIESDIDGLFLEGEPDDSGVFRQSYADLQYGEHLLTISARDEFGNAVTASSSLLVNAIPTASNIIIRPEKPTTIDDLEVLVPQTSDDDGDVITLAYIWYKNGELQEEQTASTISSSYTQKGDVWSVDVIPNDGNAQGIPQNATTIIQNTSPYIETVTLTPESDVILGTALTCEGTGQDIDGDEYEKRYRWNILSQGELYDLVFFGDTFIPQAPLIQPGDEIICTATFRSGFLDESEPMQTSVTIQNQDPVFTSDVLVYVPSGDPVRVGTTMNCLASAEDPDESDVTINYIWSNGSNILRVDAGLESGVPTELTLTEGNAKRDDIIQCKAIVSDPHGGQIEQESTGNVVLNTAPVTIAIGMNPLNPTTQDDITCVPVSVDIDDDEITYEYFWAINSNVVQTGTANILEGPFSSGDIIRCGVTPSDGQDYDATGTFSFENVQIHNTPPEVQSIIITPTSPTINDLLVGAVDVIDIDNNTLTLTYAWYVDGEVVKDSLGNSLDGQTYFQRNQQVYVAVTPYDGFEYGQTIVSDVITIQNSAPLIDEAEILPEEPTPSVDDLICTLPSPPTDSDGDDIDITISWTKNGVPYTGGTNETTYLNDTIPAVFTSDGDQWECTVEVSDDTLSNSVTSVPRDVVCLSGYGDIESCAASSCKEILTLRPSTYAEDGLYWLNPNGDNPFEAYCDMTHDGGGWTLVLKTTGSATDLFYDSIYWESEAVLNTSYNNPNENETGESSKFPAYNDVEGETLRLEFVAPTEWNIHHYDLGICSKTKFTTKDDCEAAGTCSDLTFTDQGNCENSGACSDSQFTSQSDCEADGASWTANEWTFHEWDLGLTALSLFQGGQIMIQGNLEPDGCPSGVLIQDYSDEMMFAVGYQFFGINGSTENSGTQGWLKHESNIRFGMGSQPINGYPGLTISWRPQIGIGLHDYRSIGPTSNDKSRYNYSTAWIDPIQQTSTCGYYGNGLGADAEDAASNLWIR